MMKVQNVMYAKKLEKNNSVSCLTITHLRWLKLLRNSFDYEKTLLILECSTRAS